MAIAVAILFGTLSRDWASGPISAAPAGFEACAPECHPIGDDGAPTDLVALRWISMFGGFLSAVMCAFGAHRLHRELPAPIGLATLVFGVTLAAMIAFEVRALTALDASLGTGAPIAAIGLIAAAIALRFTARGTGSS
jgi:uncharacterized membrane protein